jgi:mannose-6-phosphate isomerase-like protein (cupin superfamily)
MELFNRGNSKNTGTLTSLRSWMLIGSRNSSAQAISMQISEIPVGSGQPVHAHAPEQCYYIIKGSGLMMIEDETRQVHAGDAVYIPPNKPHGIKNIGDTALEYLTANSPAFTHEYEDKLWPSDPA